MDIVKVVGFAFITTFFLIILRRERPEFATVAVLAAGAVMLVFILSKVWQVIKVLQELAWQAKVNMVYFRIVLKVVGVAYITGFGAQICRDAGEGAMAIKVEMAGKVIIILLAIPVLTAILQTVMRFL